jgi:hypothetical protein
VLYPGETVRLLRALPAYALAQGCEGHVVEVHLGDEEEPTGAVVQFYDRDKRPPITLPRTDLELVISSVGACTAVFWSLAKPAAQIVEGAMHAVMDRGPEMREGLNVQRLKYDSQDRFWRREEKLADSTGALVVASASSWDGCVAAFTGRQRLHLEFRLQGPKPPYVLLHQRYELLEEQRRTTHPAMNLLRLMFNLYDAIGAEYAAVPVADNWLADESFDSLLQPPYFPDLFLLPRTALPAESPLLFRSAHLHHERAVLTALPVKFSPTDVGFERTDEELKLNRMRASEALGEKAYDQLYDARSSSSASAFYSDAKESFYDAISLARELGLSEQAERLSHRLEHIKAVFRSQFS